MTPVKMLFVTPEGVPIRNTPVEILPSRSSFNEADEGIIMPRPASAVTDNTGQCTVPLWPSQIPYFVTCADTESEAVIFYRFVVPDSVTPVRLQDILVDNGIGFSGIYFEMASNTQLRIKARGTDGIVRSVILPLT